MAACRLDGDGLNNKDKRQKWLGIGSCLGEAGGLIEDEIGSALGVARPVETDVVDQI